MWLSPLIYGLRKREGKQLPNRVYGIIKLKLRSDICIGSGYSHAGMIDSDICYDNYGIPYIPAKRLKGCLRNSLETLLYSRYQTSEDLFGASGNDTGSDLRLDNAYIDGYEELVSLIKRKKKKKSDIYDAQTILGRFTRIAGQTRLIDGIAIDKSLHFMRVVRQKSPLSAEDEDLVFVATVSCSEENWDCLNECVRATRHIGLKRNRGMGYVSCVLEKTMTKELDTSSIDTLIKNHIDVSGHAAQERVRLDFSVKNLAALMLCDGNNSVSASYISGRNVMGAMAKHLLSYGISADSELFRTLFLKEEVFYSNLYPSLGFDNFYPVPGFINKLKKSSAIVNTLARMAEEDVEDERYNPSKGNDAKRIKGGFINIDMESNRYQTIEVSRDVVYHNSIRNKKSEESQGQLYSVEVLTPGQYFSGSIECPANCAPIIKKLLKEADLYFGKSRSSEYGKCTLIGEVKETALEERPKVIEAGEEFVLVFNSDSAFIGQEGGASYRTDFDNVVKAAMAELLTQNMNSEISEEVLTAVREKSLISSGVSSGYQSKWNLQRDAVPVVAAGSYITFKAKKSVEVSTKKLGEFKSEGYGDISILSLNNMKYRLGRKKIEEEKGIIPIASSAESYKKLFYLMKPVLLGDWLDNELNKDLLSRKTEINVDNTAVGRFILMLSESVSENRNDSNAALESFEKRINSIRNEYVRKEGLVLVEKARSLGRTDDGYASISELSDLQEKSGLTDETIEDMKNSLWSRYINILLNNRKYEGRNEN